jgi:hypothetical protein
LLEPAFDMAMQDRFVEFDRPFEIGDPQHDMVETGYADPFFGTCGSFRFDNSRIRHRRLLLLAVDYSTANQERPAAGLLRRCRSGLRCGVARMLAAPGAPLCAIKNAVMIGVHLVEANTGALRGPFASALQVLLASDAVGSRGSGCRRRTVDSRGLLYGLGRDSRRQQRQSKKYGRDD